MDELRSAELAKTVDEWTAHINDGAGPPIGTWCVMSESQTRGDLGTWTGHVADIAARFAAQGKSDLTFRRVPDLMASPVPPSARVSIHLSDVRRPPTGQEEGRDTYAAAVERWLQTEPSAYGSVSGVPHLFDGVQLDLSA